MENDAHMFQILQMTRLVCDLTKYTLKTSMTTFEYFPYIRNMNTKMNENMKIRVQNRMNEGMQIQSYSALLSIVLLISSIIHLPIQSLMSLIQNPLSPSSTVPGTVFFTSCPSFLDMYLNHFNFVFHARFSRDSRFPCLLMISSLT